MINPRILQKLFSQLEAVIEISGELQTASITQGLPATFKLSPGFPPPEIKQHAVIQEAEDFILITETLLKCHMGLLQARKELIMIGVQSIGQEGSQETDKED